MKTYRLRDVVAPTIAALALGFFLQRLDAQTGFFQKVTLLVSGAPACAISAGSGSPEGAVTGNICDMYLRTNGASGTTIYIKVSGTGNTGWENPGSTGNPSGAGAPTVVLKKTADESVTSSTTLQSDDHLVVAIAANETWLFNYYLQVDGATTGDLKLALNVPASATGAWAITGLQTGATTTTDTVNTAGSTDLTDTGVQAVGTAGSGTPTLVRITAVIVNSTNAGNVTLRWAQNASDGTATKLLTNSRLEGSNLSQPLVTSAVFSSRPSNLVPGRLFLPSDAYYIQRDNGSAWVGWGPIFGFTTPSDTGFSWVNQGTSTLATTKDALYLETPVDGNTTNLRLRTHSAPATPWTVTAFILSSAGMKSNHEYGLFWRESSTSKFSSCGLLGVTNDSYQVRSGKWTNATTLSANYQTPQGDNYRWIQISDNGTNLICRMSADGQNFIQWHTISRTDFMTGGPNEYGFFCRGDNAATPNIAVGCTVLSLKVS